MRTAEKHGKRGLQTEQTLSPSFTISKTCQIGILHFAVGSINDSHTLTPICLGCPPTTEQHIP